MEEKNIENELEGFFIEDDKKFSEEETFKLINRVKKFAKLVGKEGKIHIEKKTLSEKDKSKLYLVARYLASKLGELKPEIKINPKIKTITIKEFSQTFSISQDNARARMSQLIKEGFATRPKKGEIEIIPYKVEGFIKEIEEEKPFAKKRNIKRTAPSIKKYPKIKEQIDTQEKYQKIKEAFKIEESTLKDNLVLKNNGTFKISPIKGKSKSNKQQKCALASAYILFKGFEKDNFESRFLTKICKISGIDHTRMKDSIKILKRKGFIDNDGRNSTKLRLKEKGKKEAEKIIKEIFGGLNE
jgi:hypothetical protein